MKLAKLPDRTPVKMTIVLTPELAGKLRRYAKLYAATYGQTEELGSMLPYMLETFLNGDAHFKRAERDTEQDSHN